MHSQPASAPASADRRRPGRALSLKPSGHELGNVAVFGDGHAEHGPLRHRGIMLVARERPVFCLICKPTKIKDTTTPTEATICAR
jgi:hypothetical protein